MNVNPADCDDIIGAFPLSTEEDAERAVQSSHRAFQTWGKLHGSDRAAYIKHFIDALEKRQEEIARVLVREVGKTLKEARAEPSRSIVESYYNMGEIDHMEGLTLPSDRTGVTSVANRVPLGVVSAINPWNFPFMTPVRKIIPALAAGNTVVFKPSSDTPLSGVLLMELFEEAGLPAGVVNMVIGGGKEIGDVLSGHPLVQGVTFTGSTAVGQRIASMAANNFIKLQLEMGGKNPAIVADCHDLAAAAVTIADGAMQLAGQRCTAISRVIVLEEQAEELETLLEKRLTGYKIGSSATKGAMYGPMINASAGEKAMKYIQKGIDEGAELRCGGHRLSGGEYDKGFYIEPTLFTHVKPEMTIAIDEIFGPVLSVLRVRDFEEAMRVANDTEYGLSSCLFSENNAYRWIYMRDMESGHCHINHGTVTDSCMPFAGVKHSGMGAPSKGSTNRDFFTKWKMVYVKYI
jgi:aldehyde dehydrogenase (NAD+)